VCFHAGIFPITNALRLFSGDRILHNSTRDPL
jgi:hypothetical protein